LTAALNETGNSDPTRPRLRATRTEAGWRLDGEKTCVPAAAKAACILVPASIEPSDDSDGSKGEAKVAVFLVPPDSPGLVIQEQKAINWQLHGMLEFSGVEVTRDGLLGDEDSGASIVDWILQRTRLGIAAMMLGVGEEGLKRTAAYLSDRKQFGRQIGSFQAVQMRCADAYVDLEGMRSTLWQAVWRVDANLRAGTEVGAAKWWASRAGDRIVHSAQHLHAGIGSDVDYPIHRYFLWAQQLTNLLGGPTQVLAEIGAMLVSDEHRPTL
jgi:alkylation response protein AidB-like acyl-CoA dehydrogenase